MDELFEQLRRASTPAVAEAAAERIWDRWLQHDQPEIMALMSAGSEALEQEAFGDALEAFSAVIDYDPEYAEGWNKRATVRYLIGNYSDAFRDLKRTLEREPRHFGALSGLGAIYLIVMAREQALHVFERLLKIYPLAPQVRKQVRVLRDALGYNG